MTVNKSRAARRSIANVRSGLFDEMDRLRGGKATPAGVKAVAGRASRKLKSIKRKIREGSQ
jgi:hypothetical protein